MPTIAVVDGVRIMIFPYDHNPPHVHALASDFRLKLAIADGRILEARGAIGPAVIRRLQRWVLERRERLNQLWIEAARGNPISQMKD